MVLKSKTFKVVEMILLSYNKMSSTVVASFRLHIIQIISSKFQVVKALYTIAGFGITLTFITSM